MEELRSLNKLLALSIELEGFITVRNMDNKRFYPTIGVNSKSQFICVYFKELTGLGTVHLTSRGWWSWRIQARDEVVLFLRKTLPYYWLKEPQARLALKLARDTKNRELYERILEANRGYPRFDLERLQDKELPTETIRKLVEDPVFFVEKLFGEEPFDYQKEICWEIQRQRVVNVIKGRQIGASRGAAYAVIHHAATHSFHRCLILSLYKDQAKQILNYCKEFLLRRPEIMYELVDMPYGFTRTSLRLLNGTTIEACNCSKPTAVNVRSKVAHFNVVDEAILIYDKMMPSIEPVTATTHGKELWISTAGAEGCVFHAKVERGKQRATSEELICPERSSEAKVYRGPEGSVFYLPSCVYHQDEGEIDKRFTDILCPLQTAKRLQDALDNLKDIGFRREYGCQWLGKENSVFPVIWKWGPNHEPYDTPRLFWAGIDVGETTNPTVLTILQGDSERCKAVKTRDWKRAPSRKRLAQWIAQALKPYKPGAIHMDKTGIGAGLYERIEELGLPVMGKSWNRTVKNQLMWDLKDGIMPGSLRIHEDMDQLLFEMRGYYAEPVEGANIFDFYAIDTDDYVDSLALAWDAVPKWAYTQLPGPEVRERRVL